MIKVIAALGQTTVQGVQNMSEAELQTVVDRPFQPSIGNPDFDFEKYLAILHLHLIKKTRAGILQRCPQAHQNR